jgi:lysophospholipase L1-like esterase
MKLKFAVLKNLFSVFRAAFFRVKFNHSGSGYAFIGDSITEGWRFPQVNLGKHGQTTAQISERLPSALFAHDYKTVVILGGTNDVLLNIPANETIRNLDAMVNLALAHGAEPILCEIPPILRRDHKGQSYNPAVRELNRKIKELAATRHLKLTGYYDAMVGHEDFYSDGVHLKRLGYLMMEYEWLKIASS